MRFRLIISVRAAADVDRLEGWLLDKNPAAALKVAPLLFTAFDGLTRMPERTRQLIGETHELQVPFGGSGYVIRYEVSDREVIVTRVFHALEDRSRR